MGWMKGKRRGDVGWITENEEEGKERERGGVNGERKGE